MYSLTALHNFLNNHLKLKILQKERDKAVTRIKENRHLQEEENKAEERR